ncbi:MAG TPA: glycosyl hydrolase [Terriglobales bacterium]|nr:glycosyl hydrolase [Terriglobales bacterium]
MGSPVRFRLQGTFRYFLCMNLLLFSVSLCAQTVQVGAGSYTTALPAGATAPSNQIFSSVAGPKPTHRFWTAKNWYADNIINGGVTFGGGGGGPFVMFPQPLGMQTTPTGLLLGFDATVTNGGTFFFQPFEGDLTLGVTGLNAGSVNVSGYSDWTVDFNFGPMTTRVGRGMPFVYVTTNGSNPTITFAGQPTVFANNGNILGVSIANNNYGLFCPSGGSWSGIGGTVLTCNLPGGHNYFSLALLPNAGALSTYSQFAFSFPVNTQVAWNYNPNTSQVSTTYTVSTQAKEGGQTGFLMALYPHQYTALQGSAINTSFTYPSSRGTLKVLQGTAFTTTDIFHGILPFLPNTGNFSDATLTSLVDTVANEPNHFTVSQSGGGTNTYDIGKDLARVAHLLPIAKVAGDTNAASSLQTSLQNELQNWFNGAANHQNTSVFYYDGNWGTLIGYPGAFGSDVALNDHHFHYGYWIHSAAIVGLLNPTWIQSNNWGGMVNLLGRDIATPVRNDAMFPFLRHFDVYGGHSWASGQAPFGDGLNQESSSEAMNAWTGLILFATETGNTQLRDAAIWMYTQETNGIFDYWFNDGPVSTFPPGFTRTEIANVFDGKSDTGTFFSGQIELEHGIEFLPFHGGSLYLGRDPAYIQRNLAEIKNLDPNAFAAGSVNWPDLIEEYQALSDPNTALSEFNNTSFVFDGESKAHEYYWITQLQKLGQSDEAVTANTPLYHVFKNPATGAVTHAAFNPGTSAITVNFSDGASLSVPPGSMRSEFGTTTIGSGGTSSADFSLSAAPASQSVTAGSSASYTITVGALNGFSSSVALTASGLPTGATASFTPASVNGSGSSTLAVSTSSTTPAGSFTLTITGTSGSLTHTAMVTLIVNPVQGQCLTSGTTWQNTTLPVETGSFTVTFDATPSRSSATSPINSVIALSNGAQTAFTGFATLVAFNANGIQARNGGTFTAASVIPYTGGVAYHFREVINVPAHTYSIFVTAPGGAEQTVGSNFAFRTEQNRVTQLNNWGTFALSGSVRVCNFTLVTAAPNFAIAATPSTVTVTAGSNANYTTNVSAVNGFSGSVGLSMSGLPAGAAAGFSPASINGSGSSTLTVTTATSTPAGTYTLTTMGTSGSLNHSTTVTLVVNSHSTPDFSLAVSPNSQTVTAGNGTSYTATVTPLNGFTGTVALSISGLPTGTSGAFTPVSINGSGASTLTISTATSTPAASTTLTITATSGNLSHSGAVTLAVQAGSSCVGPNCTSKRLKIINGCGKPMWIFFQTGFNGGTLNAQNQKLLTNVGDFIEYDIPDKGLAGVRFWPGMECDNTGNNCHIGASGGPVSNGFTCPANIGCAPPIDSKFEGTFGCVSSMPLSQCQANPSSNPPTPLPRADFWDASMVDGYTLPVKVIVHGSCPPGNPGGLPEASSTARPCISAIALNMRT